MKRLDRIRNARICFFGVSPGPDTSEVYSESVGVSSVYGTFHSLPLIAQRIKVFGETQGDVTIGNEKITFLFVNQPEYYTAIKKGEDAVIEYAHLYSKIVKTILEHRTGKLWVFGPDALIAMVQELCDKHSKFSYFDHQNEKFDFEYIIVFSKHSKKLLPDAVKREAVVCLS